MPSWQSRAKWRTLSKRFFRVMAYANLNLSVDGTNPLPPRPPWAGPAPRRPNTRLPWPCCARAPQPAEGVVESTWRQKPASPTLPACCSKCLAEKPYTLSRETEEALASLREVLEAPGMIYNRSKAADMTFAPVLDSKGNNHPMSLPFMRKTTRLLPIRCCAATHTSPSPRDSRPTKYLRRHLGHRGAEKMWCWPGCGATNLPLTCSCTGRKSAWKPIMPCTTSSSELAPHAPVCPVAQESAGSG